jgi:hypothetical protein
MKWIQRKNTYEGGNFYMCGLVKDGRHYTNNIAILSWIGPNEMGMNLGRRGEGGLANESVFLS